MKSLNVLIVPVDWLLVDVFFCIKNASVMDHLLWLNSVNNIFVLLTRSSLHERHVVLGLQMLCI